MRACARACRACRSDDSCLAGGDRLPPHRRAAPLPCAANRGARLRPRGAALFAAARRRSGRRRFHDALATRRARGRASGAAIVAINPLHALFAGDRERASPYYPSDRLFLDPIYLDIVRGGDFFDAPNTGRLVDYPAVHALKQQFLERAFKGVEDFAQARPDARTVARFRKLHRGRRRRLFRFACFETISEQRGGEDWRRWPQAAARRRAARAGKLRARKRQPHPLSSIFCNGCAKANSRGRRERRRTPASRSAFAAISPLARRPTVARAGATRRIFSRAFRSARRPMLLRETARTGACRRPIRCDGRRTVARVLASSCARTCATPGALRIDHVMGLARLFVVPEGGKPLEGAYLSYPLDDLLAELALESQRAQCAVIGEDLGTLPWGFSERLARQRRMLSYRVFWFEREGDGFAPPAHYAQMAMACVSTHDLPTLKGWWEGADIAEKLALGLLSEEDARKERETRREDRRLLLAALARRRTARGRRRFRRALQRRSRRAPRTPMWRARPRCWRWRKSTILPAKRSPSICREPTGSARTGGASSTRKRRFCSKAVWRAILSGLRRNLD